ncbi:unnamed protein product [Phyllotreta striolata]|uniref:Uncharacterized protein n=1 Tax=Phyllotreta striolata TaxID=444603 RepID=A0A9N9XNK1_PHYSR|nr:unnamed protein product [Phyllotreta striolata]
MPLDFVLYKTPVPHPNECRRMVTIHTSKRRYDTPYLKADNWECYPLSRPIDYNPLCPEHYNLSRSHYNRLGIETDEDWSTSTKSMFKYQLEKKRPDLEVNPDKSLVNFFTKIPPEGPPREYLPTDCIPYISEMRYRYEPPFPQSTEPVKKRPSHKLENRKLACIPGKFLDENYRDHTKLLQCSKLKRHISYNPYTNLFTDGTPAVPPTHNKSKDYREYIKNFQP